MRVKGLVGDSYGAERPRELEEVLVYYLSHLAK